MKLSEIKANPNNPRLIKDDKFKKLVKSISEFPKMMELRPIVIDSEGMILGGNMRFKALQELKYKEVPDEWIKRADELTEEEKKRFIIADNVGFGDWDFDLLTDWDSDKLTEWGLEFPIYDNSINDIEQVDEFTESVNFTIKCDSIEQLEELQTKLNVSVQKIKYKDFLIKAGL
jgi:ParB-like chromosome segregation protein Spo0J